ncbi:MAG: VPLPA-CTERM sorting domain-containing protein [Nitrospira sp.]|nr:VPLPA-CTERM sorting domain-containing protein [Nitrospira sp.]
MKFKSIVFVILLALPSLGNAASIDIVALESGGDVVITASGSIDLTGLPVFGGAIITGGLVNPVGGSIFLGIAGISDIYSGGAATTTYGSGPLTESDGDTGLGGTLGTALGRLYVPAGYVSLDPLNKSSTYDNTTFAALGMDVGSYLWTFSNGETLSLQIGQVPIPAAAWLFGSALLGLAAVKRGKRKQNC